MTDFQRAVPNEAQINVGQAQSQRTKPTRHQLRANRDSTHLDDLPVLDAVIGDALVLTYDAYGLTLYRIYAGRVVSLGTYLDHLDAWRAIDQLDDAAVNHGRP